MQFVDLAAQQKRISEKIEFGLKKVLAHGKYILGPEVSELETQLAEYVGVKYAVGCASGTDALLLSLMAHGVGPGDAIFTTPFTFIATAEVISLLGATPVFVDIDPVTFNIDPLKLELAVRALKEDDATVYPLPVGSERLTARGVIAVDLFGLAADYNAVKKIAVDNDLIVIQDAAQSFGGKYNGEMNCRQGGIACTSFFPAKPLGGYGDGGMCFTDNDDFKNILTSLRVHGKGGHKYDNIRIGINGRLDTIQAAILLAKFEIFPGEVELRQKVASSYSDMLSNMNLILPTVPGDCRSAWAQYSVLAENEKHRSALQDELKKADIPTAVYYPRPLHLQSAFSFLGYKEQDFTVSEDCAARIFSLPMHSYLSTEEQMEIVNVIEKVG